MSNKPKSMNGKLWEKLKNSLGEPVNGASLAFFRMAVGIVMTLEAWSLLRPSMSSGGKVMLETYYTGAEITFNLPYEFVSWLPLFSKQVIYGIVAALGVGGICMALGLFYRLAAAVVFLCWAYLYAAEATRTYWMSYYYLELIITFLMIWLPANRRFSLDSILAAGKGKPSRLDVPFWSIAILRAQLVITYFYAGVAKINKDWILDGVPVRDFLNRPEVIGRLQNFFGLSGEKATAFVMSPTVIHGISLAGLLFDLSIGFLLLARRTRKIGMVLLLLFHGTNHFILFDDIIWFPLLGVLTATIFWDPGWFERLVNRIKTHKVPVFKRISAGGAWTPATSGIAMFFCAWTLFQIILPVRHYLIPGDGRFTWEGLSFSWRLKAEFYRSTPCEITVGDSTIVTKDESGKFTIDMDRWKGEKVFYQWIPTEKTDWSRLPELITIFEEECGERILYNPYAGKIEPLRREQSLARVNILWQELYGRPPRNIRPTIPMSDLLEGYNKALVAMGTTPLRTQRETLTFLLATHGVRGNGQMLPLLRASHPFAFNGEQPPGTPFFYIDDPSLLANGSTNQLRIDRTKWKPVITSEVGTEPYVFKGIRPLVIYTKENRFDQRSSFSQTYLFDEMGLNQGPRFYWDYLSDVPVSKAMHISSQPFLLRRYARRVAELWEKEHGSRPSVYAVTAVSLNGRPYQNLVDPAADLARVGVTYFRHNPWIMDLELPRIPRESLQK